MLRAHYHQARTLRRRIHETEQLFDSVAQLVDRYNLPDRATGALAEAARGRRLRRPIYSYLVQVVSGESISDLSASRDLRTLVEAGVLE